MWVTTAERLPQREDADELGLIWTWSGTKQACQKWPPEGVFAQNWRHFHNDNRAHGEHWFMWHPKPATPPPRAPDVPHA